MQLNEKPPPPDTIRFGLNTFTIRPQIHNILYQIDNLLANMRYLGDTPSSAAMQTNDFH